MTKMRSKTSYEQLWAENAVLREALEPFAEVARKADANPGSYSVADMYHDISNIELFREALTALDYRAMGELVEADGERERQLETQLAAVTARAEAYLEALKLQAPHDSTALLSDLHQQLSDKRVAMLELKNALVWFSQQFRLYRMRSSASITGVKSVDWEQWRYQQIDLKAEFAAYNHAYDLLHAAEDLSKAENVLYSIFSPETFGQAVPQQSQPAPESPSQDATVARPAVLLASNHPNNEHCPFENGQHVRLAIDYPNGLGRILWKLNGVTCG